MARTKGSMNKYKPLPIDVRKEAVLTRIKTAEEQLSQLHEELKAIEEEEKAAVKEDLYNLFVKSGMTLEELADNIAKNK